MGGIPQTGEESLSRHTHDCMAQGGCQSIREHLSGAAHTPSTFHLNLMHACWPMGGREGRAFSLPGRQEGTPLHVALVTFCLLCKPTKISLISDSHSSALVKSDCLPWLAGSSLDIPHHYTFGDL